MYRSFEQGRIPILDQSSRKKNILNPLKILAQLKIIDYPK